MQVPLILITPEQMAQGYREFDGFDAAGRARLRHRRHRVVQHRDDGMWVVVDPTAELAKQLQMERRP